MAKYQAAYKCPLCGRLFRWGDPVEIPYNKLPELLAMVIKNQRFVGTQFYTAPMQLPCNCPDGSAGMAHFAGFRKV